MSTETNPAPTEKKDIEYRLDGRHPAARPTSDRAAEPATVSATAAAVPDLQQVRNHASQLAAHLQAMRHDIDRRESEINSRAAEADKEMRAARLWFQERQEELDQRAEELDQQTEQLDQRTEELDPRTEELDQRTEELDQRERAVSPSDQEDHQKAVEKFALRQQHLDEAEAILTNSQADLEVQRAQLKAERQRSEAQMRAIRTQLAQRQRELDTQWQQRQEALARRGEQLDSRQAANQQARQEVTELHREALALRLATQELWVKLSQAAPAPALTTELGRIRRRLAESYCMERDAAVEEKQKLQAVHKKLADQYFKLNAEKKQLHDWVTRRERDIEQQAARLIAREQELDRQRIEQANLLKQWEQDRRQYHERIRGLTRQLRRDRPAKRFSGTSLGAACPQPIEAAP